VRLVSARPLAPAVRELVLERCDGEPLDFEPGQWVNLVLPVAGGDIKRAYSIASPPPPRGAPARFELAVTRVEGGPGSLFLHELPIGATLRAIGPQGFFTRRATDGAPSLFIGTGTGVTPLRSMILAALGAGAGERLWLLFGARREEDVLYCDELLALGERHPNLRFEVTLSRPSDAWQGRRGHVQAHLPELCAALRAERVGPHAYVCGLERMVSSVRKELRGALGFERREVHAERYD
jgi:ferredoxin-NADP reductase